MPPSSRRRLLQTCLAAPIAGSLARGLRTRGEAVPPANLGLEPLGKVEPRTGREIAASPLSVGFETLDRRMFDPERTYEHLARLGVKWARVQTGWSRCETEPGVFEFGWLDAVVDRLLEMGVQPWFNLGYGNRLYSPEAPDAFAVGWVPLGERRREDAWLRYVRTMADRYRDRVRHWEIWNEPNHTSFWRPSRPDPADYLRLVRMTAPVIREQVPDAVLIGGAMAGIGREFFRGCIEAGLGALIDRFSYHPYRAVPEHRYDRDVTMMRRLLAEHAPDVRLWQGENGAPSTEGSAGALRQFPWNEARQAKWLLRRIMTDLRLEIELTSYFHMVDLVEYSFSGDRETRPNTKGLLRGTDCTPKPSYFAYQCLCSLMDAETKRNGEVRAGIETDRDAAGRIEPDRIHQAGFLRAGRALLAYWHPADLFDDFASRRVDVRLDAPEAFQPAAPVLIDPLSARIYRLTPEPTEAGPVFRGLPLTDYPLIVTDRAVVQPV